MSRGTVTIKFRAKRDEFAGGYGYKVPALTSRHLTFSREVDNATKLYILPDRRALVDPGIEVKLRRVAGLDHVPGVVWEPDSMGAEYEPDNARWTVSPVGNGFMADVSIVLELVK